MNENLVNPHSKNIKKTIDLSVDVFFEINFIEKKRLKGAPLHKSIITSLKGFIFGGGNPAYEVVIESIRKDSLIVNEDKSLIFLNKNYSIVGVSHLNLLEQKASLIWGEIAPIVKKI